LDRIEAQAYTVEIETALVCVIASPLADSRLPNKGSSAELLVVFSTEPPNARRVQSIKPIPNSLKHYRGQGFKPRNTPVLRNIAIASGFADFSTFSVCQSGEFSATTVSHHTINSDFVS
jgi:hypothetical protein